MANTPDYLISSFPSSLSKVELEKPLLRNFKKYASMEVSDKDNFWEIVSLAQHHGLPTRLLDWTFSP